MGEEVYLGSSFERVLSSMVGKHGGIHGGRRMTQEPGSRRGEC